MSYHISTYPYYSMTAYLCHAFLFSALLYLTSSLSASSVVKDLPSFFLVKLVAKL